MLVVCACLLQSGNTSMDSFANSRSSQHLHSGVLMRNAANAVPLCKGRRPSPEHLWRRFNGFLPQQTGSVVRAHISLQTRENARICNDIFAAAVHRARPSPTRWPSDKTIAFAAFSARMLGASNTILEHGAGLDTCAHALWNALQHRYLGVFASIGALQLFPGRRQVIRSLAPILAA